MYQKKICSIRQSLESTTSIRWFHWSIVALSFVVTFFAWSYANKQMHARVQLQFDREADHVVELVIERMTKYEDALRAGVAFLDASDGEIDHNKWQRYASSIHIEQKYPGIDGLGVIFSVSRDRLPEFLADERVHRPNFGLHPSRDSDEYWPITHIVPSEGNEEAIGLDMAHEVNRFTAAKKARDTGTTQVTAPIVLAQDSHKMPGFLFYAPFYRARSGASSHEVESEFFGLVYAPFVVHRLMAGTLDKTNRHIGISIEDAGDVLYDEHTESEADFDADPLYEKTVSIPIYGREWTFHICSLKSFRQNVDSTQPATILVAGIIIDSMLLCLFIVLTRSSRRALRLAKEMTVDLEVTASELERSLRLQTAILDAAGVAIIATGIDGKISIFNSAAEDMLGYTKEELLHVHTPGLLHDGDEVAERAQELSIELGRHVEPGFDVFVTKTIDGITEQREWTYLRKDGTRFPVLLTITALRDQENKISGFLGMAADISERKIAMQKIEQANASLARSNEELAQFAYVASHDLQEPLRKVTSFCELLEEDCGEQISEAGKQYMAFIMDGGTRMRSLIQDLLSYSRIESDGHSLLVVDTNDALQFAIENLSEAIRESDSEVTFDELPRVYADAGRIAQVLQNLIANAIKYHGDAVPKVHISSREFPRHIEFAVQDNGIGIDPEYRKQIFGVFKRLHNQSRYKGTGIGLAICKRIIDQLGGRIWVDSSPGGGSTFRFEIPIKADPKSATSAAESPIVHSQGNLFTSDFSDVPVST